jgi:hypothetical protein
MQKTTDEIPAASQSRINGLLPKQYPFEWPLRVFCSINFGETKDQQ